MTEYIWLIGGSLMSIPMAREIKARGYKLLLTDINEQCACRKYADKFYPISVFDEDYHRALAKVWRWGNVVEPEQYGKIAAILCIGCDAGPTVSLISDYLCLPSVGHKTAKQAKNKFEVRKALNLEHPNYGLLTKHSLISNKPLNRWNYPVVINYPSVVKPVADSGSKGFMVVSSNDELKKALDAIKGEALTEELLIGQDIIPEWRDKYGFDTSEIALDFFVQDGKVHYANGALRLFWADLPGIEAGHINPYVPSPEIVEKAQYAAEKLGVAWGPFKCDFKQDQRYGWVVMECATRLSGGYDHAYTCPLATGKDITGAMLDVALGKPFSPEMVEAKYHSFVCAYAPRFRPGEIWGWQKIISRDNEAGEVKVQTTPKTESLPDKTIISLGNGYEIYQENQEIKPLTSNHHRSLFVIRRGQSEADALKVAMEYAKGIKPNYVG